MKKLFTTASSLLLLATMLNAQNIVTINKSIQYQKMDGFGTQYGKNVYWSSPPFFDEDHLRRVIDEMGISMHRTWIDPKLEMVNDNDDPNNTDLAKFKANLSALSTDPCAGEYVAQKDWIAYMNAYKARALANGDTIKFFASVITPPAWMKYVGCIFGTDYDWNRMATSEYEKEKGGTDGVGGVKDFKDEFAEFLYGTVKVWKDAGIDFYAVGIQNEPQFGEPYGSCVYSPQAMAGTIGAVGSRFEKENIKTKILYPEDIGNTKNLLDYVSIASTHPIASKYEEIFGVHQYNQDGVSPGSLAASTWSKINKIANYGGKYRPIWMTETSGFPIGVQGLTKMYGAIYTALKFGKVNAFQWYDATDGDNEVENGQSFFVKINGKQVYTKKAQAFRHFSKYIRPGSIAVDATCSTDPDVLSLAFQDNYRKRLTIILINNDTVNSKSIKLAFTDATSPKKFTGFVTSATDDYKSLAEFNAGNTIVLPPRSIHTLIGDNSLPVTPTDVLNQNIADLVSVYPNPAKNQLFVTLPNDRKFDELTITDLTGRTLMTQKILSDKVEMNVENLYKGMYIINIKGESNVRKTFVVE